MPYVCPRIDGSPSDSEAFEDEGESARGCTRLHPTPDWSVSRRVGLRAPCSTPLFNYHRDYISQRRKFSSASNKGKCVLKSQGRKYIRSVVLVDALDNKIPRGKRRTSLQQSGCIVGFVEFWSEGQVVQAIEVALGSVLDECEQHPRLV